MWYCVESGGDVHKADWHQSLSRCCSCIHASLEELFLMLPCMLASILLLAIFWCFGWFLRWLLALSVLPMFSTLRHPVLHWTFQRNCLGCFSLLSALLSSWLYLGLYLICFSVFSIPVPPPLFSSFFDPHSLLTFSPSSVKLPVTLFLISCILLV